MKIENSPYALVTLQAFVGAQRVPVETSREASATRLAQGLEAKPLQNSHHGAAAGATHAAAGALAQQNRGAAAREDEAGAEAREQAREQSLEETLDALRERLHADGLDLKFHLDDDVELVQVELRDAATGKVLRKIPSDEAVQLAQRLAEEGDHGALYSKVF